MDLFLPLCLSLAKLALIPRLIGLWRQFSCIYTSPPLNTFTNQCFTPSDQCICRSTQYTHTSQATFLHFILNVCYLHLLADVVISSLILSDMITYPSQHSLLYNSSCGYFVFQQPNIHCHIAFWSYSYYVELAFHFGRLYIMRIHHELNWLTVSLPQPSSFHGLGTNNVSKFTQGKIFKEKYPSYKFVFTKPSLINLTHLSFKIIQKLFSFFGFFLSFSPLISLLLLFLFGIIYQL